MGRAKSCRLKRRPAAGTRMRMKPPFFCERFTPRFERPHAYNRQIAIRLSGCLGLAAFVALAAPYS